MEYVDTNTKVGLDVLAPGFRRNLELFYASATTAADRARCLELLTALDFGVALTKPQGRSSSANLEATPNDSNHVHHEPSLSFRRPHTAIPYDGVCRSNKGSFNWNNPYITTYQREYRAPTPPANESIRPKTATWFGAAHVRPPAGTTYSSDYLGTIQPRSVTIHPYEGESRNYPHPLQTFLTWKLPRQSQKGTSNPYSQSEPKLTEETFDKAMRGKLASTYQVDYLGVPQGYTLKSASDSVADWKTLVPVTLDSTSRRTFQTPAELIRELKVPTTRYASNKNHRQMAVGSVPNGISSGVYMNINSSTTYSHEFKDPHGGAELFDVRQLGRQYGAQALQKQLNTAPTPDKEGISQLLSCFDVRPPSSCRPPSTRPPSHRRLACAPAGRVSKPMVPPATPLFTPPPPLTRSLDTPGYRGIAAY